MFQTDQSAPAVRWGLFLLALVPSLSQAAESNDSLRLTTPRWRSPVALAVSNDDRRAYVANRDAGSISLVDLVGQQVLREDRVGEQIVAIRSLRGGELLAVDESRHELIVLDTGEQGRLRAIARMPVSRYPVSITLADDGATAHVASLWSRRLTVVDISDRKRPRPAAVIDLPFAPREQCLSRDGRWLFVADAFGGNLAVVDTRQRELATVRRLRASNIRGMALNRQGDDLLIAHQIVHRDRATTHDGVHWGGVLSNVVRTLSVDGLLPHSRELPVDDLFYLGNPDHAAGDPTGLQVTRDGRQIVAFAGVSEVGISDAGANHFEPTPVGRRPTALALNRDHRRLYVVNTHSDSISVVEVETRKVLADISLGATPSLSAAREGERLFFDATLSSDGWYSCHSCHTDGHGNGALNDNLGDDSYGAPKRILELGGVAHTGPWTWSGGASSLERQVRKSIEITMQGPSPTAAQVDALVAYLHELKPAPSLAAARQTPDDERQAARERGERLFERMQCATCHAPPRYTSEDTYDVGLEDELGNRQFNPPSLLGVSQRDRLFHDGRATSLREVLTRFQHQLDEPLEERDLDHLLQFLLGL